MFFYKNPLYYQFLFSKNDEDVSINPSFVMFKEVVSDILNRLYQGKIDEDSVHAKVLALWSMVHGLAKLVTLKGVVDTDNLEEEIEKVLSSIMV